MAKIFYDHLVAIEEVIAVIDQKKIDPQSRQKLIALVDETLHHHILDTILSSLPGELHERFLTHFHRAPHDPHLLIFLQENSTIDIGGAIQEKARKVKKNLISTIKKSKG